MLLDEPVYSAHDVSKGEVYERATGDVLGPTHLPRSNVLIFRSDNCQIVARPSGTEPKVKFYFSISDLKQLPIADPAERAQRCAAQAELHDRLRSEFLARINTMMGWE